MQKPKVAFLLPDLSGGGAERVVSILLEFFSEKAELYLILFNKCIVYQIPENVNIIYLENVLPNKLKQILYLPIYSYRLKSIISLNQIDTCISFMHFPNFVNSFTKIFNVKAKIIISERAHTGALLEKKNLKNFIASWLIRFLYKKADLVIPNSNQTSNYLKNIYNLTRLQTLYNPINVDLIYKKAAGSINVDFFNKTDFVFLNIGRLHKNKGQDHLINAFLPFKGKNVKLLILGEGPERNNLIKLINKLELSNQIHLVGFVDNPYPYIKQSDCFVLSSMIEGFPNVLIESLVLEKPVISFDCPSGPREILNFSILESAPSSNLMNDYGILVPLANVDQLGKAMQFFYFNISNSSFKVSINKNNFERYDINFISNQYQSILFD